MKKINSFMLLSSRLALLALTTLILSCSLFEAEDEAEDEPANETNKISSISDSDGSDNQVTENAAEGTTVGITAYASDADSGDTVTYSLNDDASGRFTINSGSGVVTVASGASIDYETAASHNIEVKATSSDGSTSTKAFGIAVLDEDESTGGGDATNSIGAISDVDNSSNKVDENASVGTAVGITAYAEDADAEDSVSYTLSDSAGNKFAINETSGVVTVNAKLNYESAASHSIMVQATSSDGSSTRKSFGINVIDDPNESNDGTSNDISAISDSDDSANQVNENAANGTLVGITALADDADEGEGVSYSLLRDADGRFGINATSGVVSVTDGSKINYERERAHTIEVLATSDDTSTSSAEFVISVLDVADESATDQHDVTAPEDADASANQVDESASIGTTVGITAYATDADDSDGVRYSLARSANGRFKIDGTTGVVTTAKALDYEADPSHYITVNANSDDGSVASTEFNIAVNDAAEISTTISGVAVDGYLQGANVCLDKDGDQKCTAADSAVATTTADGGYSLVVDAGDAELYPVLVQVIGGTTIDSDDPNGEPVAKDSIMNAPAGKYSLVSPLTTLVQGKIAGNSGLDADAAERLVIDDLGIDSDSNLSLFDDYVAEKQNTDLDSEAQADYDFVHSVAQLVAQAIADNIEKVSNDLNESTVVDADGEDFNEVVQIVVTEVAEDLSEVAEAVDEAIEQTEEGEEVNLTAVYEDIDDELTVDANASELEEEVALLEHEAEAQSGTSVADFMAAGFHYLDTDSEYISSNNSICYVYEYSDMVFDWDNFYSLDYDYDGDTGVFVSDGDQSAGEPSYVLVDNQWLYQPEEPLELLAENDDGSINILVREGELKIGGEVLDISGQELLTFIADDGWAEVIESYDPTVSFGAGAEILSIYDEYLVDSYWIDADSGCHDDIEDDVAANCSLIVEDSGNFYAQELSDLLNGDIFRSGSLGHYDLQFEGELNASDVYSSTGLVHFYADEENASLVATAEWYIVELADEASLKFKVPLALLNDDDGSDAPYYLITPLDGALHYVEHRPAGFVIEDAGTFFNRVAMDDILSAFNSSSQASTNACSLDDDDGDNNGSGDGDDSGDNDSGDGSDGDNNSGDYYQDWNVNDIAGKTLYLVYEDLDYYSDSGDWESSGNVINTIQFADTYSSDSDSNLYGAIYQGMFGYVDGSADSVDDLSMTWFIQYNVDNDRILFLAEGDDGEGSTTEFAKVNTTSEYYAIQAASSNDGDVSDEWIKDSALEYLYFDSSQAELICESHSLGCSDSSADNGPDLSAIYERWTETELVDKGFYTVNSARQDDGQISFYGFYLEFNSTHIIFYDSLSADGVVDEIHDWSIAESDGILDGNSADPYVLAKVSTLSDGTIQGVYGNDRDDLQGTSDGYEIFFFTSEAAATNYCLVEQGSVCLVSGDNDDDDDSGNNDADSAASSQVLFASQYELTGNNTEPYAASLEAGDVYSFSGGDFLYTWGLGEDPNYLLQRQAYGLQFEHDDAISYDSYFGLAFLAPGNSSVDISASDTLVIQTGNGASIDSSPNSHMVFTIELSGFGDSSCTYDLNLLDGSRPGEDQQTWTNPYGIHTYRVNLSSFVCTSGDMTTLSNGLEQVSVMVIGGRDASASATEDNHVLLQVGYIGFSNDQASVPGDGSSEHVLFASQYELIDGATSDPYAASQEDGGVYGFSGGDFFYTWGLGEDSNFLIQRQAYGLQFDHNATIDAGSYFGLAFKAPNDYYLDISATDTLVIQTGNGTDSDAFANSHMVFTIDLSGSGSSCSYDLELEDGSRPSSDPQGWTNPYGLQTYYLELDSFYCSAGDLHSLTSSLEQVAVKVVGGKDATASATGNNQVLLQVGYIAFASTAN